MPPPAARSLPMPTAQEILTWLETSLDVSSASRPNPGRTETFRRLNRTEYQNAIRDLLALDIDASALLPADESGHGFDNVTVGDLSPTLLDRYIAAAQKISRLAVGSAGEPGAKRSASAPDLTQEEQLEGLPIGTRGGMLRSLHLPAGRRIRDPDPPGAGPERDTSRACARPSARAGRAAGPGAGEDVHRAEVRQRRRHATADEHLKARIG